MDPNLQLVRTHTDFIHYINSSPPPGYTTRQITGITTPPPAYVSRQNTIEFPEHQTESRYQHQHHQEEPQYPRPRRQRTAEEQHSILFGNRIIEIVDDEDENEDECVPVPPAVASRPVLRVPQRSVRRRSRLQPLIEDADENGGRENPSISELRSWEPESPEGGCSPVSPISASPYASRRRQRASVQPEFGEYLSALPEPPEQQRYYDRPDRYIEPVDTEPKPSVPPHQGHPSRFAQAVGGIGKRFGRFGKFLKGRRWFEDLGSVEDTEEAFAEDPDQFEQGKEQQGYVPPHSHYQPQYPSQKGYHQEQSQTTPQSREFQQNFNPRPQQSGPGAEFAQHPGFLAPHPHLQNRGPPLDGRSQGPREEQKSQPRPSASHPGHQGEINPAQPTIPGPGPTLVQPDMAAYPAMRGTYPPATMHSDAGGGDIAAAIRAQQAAISGLPAGAGGAGSYAKMAPGAGMGGIPPGAGGAASLAQMAAPGAGMGPKSQYPYQQTQAAMLHRDPQMHKQILRWQQQNTKIGSVPDHGEEYRTSPMLGAIFMAISLGAIWAISFFTLLGIFYTRFGKLPTEELNLCVGECDGIPEVTGIRQGLVIALAIIGGAALLKAALIFVLVCAMGRRRAWPLWAWQKSLRSRFAAYRLRRHRQKAQKKQQETRQELEAAKRYEDTEQGPQMGEVPVARGIGWSG